MMSNRSFLHVLMVIPLVLFTSSCQDKNSDLLSESQMVELLCDIHLAEAAFQTEAGAKRDSLANLYYGHIFAIHGITEPDYRRNHDYYFRSPEEIDRIYELVIKALEERNTQTQQDKRGKTSREPKESKKPK